ncbi:hypothetical protein GWC77_27405 [Paraburkholderia sp. NMBU_R16]|uniref:hypothetical protein n=1 Tax=Paraburkholderia sp. NMBU_R16 TaxID=2698676 RepID=UPI0015663C06|nr:hypothetical protein [Paraburkholderia sp. NMBU_R16]NRO99588.1 hypothetical protein [Paraburkholderia sp. NMBU_R16]
MERLTAWFRRSAVPEAEKPAGTATPGSKPHPEKAPHEVSNGVLNGLQARPVAVASPIAQPTTIRRAELPLAGYLYARSSMRKTIDGDEVKALLDAQKTMDETRTALNKGRGNVIIDNENTNFDAAGRSYAVITGKDRVLEALQNQDSPKNIAAFKSVIPTAELTRFGPDNSQPLASKMALAAGAKVNESGQCDSHALLGLAQHAARMQQGQIAHAVSSDTPFPHMWGRIDAARGKGREVVFDSWAEGPAVLAEDSRRESGSENIKEELSLTPEGSKVFAQGVEKMATGMQANKSVMKHFRGVAKERTTLLQKAATKPNWNHAAVKNAHSPMPVLSDAFISEAKQAGILAADPHARERAHLGSQIRGAGVARNFGLNVKAATSDATINEIQGASQALLNIKT